MGNGTEIVGGRPRLTAKPLEKRTVRAPAEHWKAIEAAGAGNVSAGMRAIVEGFCRAKPPVVPHAEGHAEIQAMVSRVVALTGEADSEADWYRELSALYGTETWAAAVDAVQTVEWSRSQRARALHRIEPIEDVGRYLRVRFEAGKL